MRAKCPQVVLMREVIERCPVLDRDRLVPDRAVLLLHDREPVSIHVNKSPRAERLQIHLYLALLRLYALGKPRRSDVARQAWGLILDRVFPGAPQCIREDLLTNGVKISLAAVACKLIILILVGALRLGLVIVCSLIGYRNFRTLGGSLLRSIGQCCYTISRQLNTPHS